MVFMDDFANQRSMRRKRQLRDKITGFIFPSFFTFFQESARKGSSKNWYENWTGTKPWIKFWGFLRKRI